MEHRILVAGFGGQGVLLIGQILCHGGMHAGKNVSWLPSYGPEMRGGTASCSVILADGEIGSPMVTKADDAIVMNKPSFDKYHEYVRPGGRVFINSSLIGKPAVREDVEGYYVPANDAASQAGNLRAANMAMLGAYNAVARVLPDEVIKEALAEMFGERRAHLLQVNHEAMAIGAQMSQKA